jgi:hypothetical protein
MGKESLALEVIDVCPLGVNVVIVLVSLRFVAQRILSPIVTYNAGVAT